MKSAVLVCVLFITALTQARPDTDHYNDHYDNVDLEEILDNEKLYEAYFKCLLDLGKCTPEGKELKSHIKEALENGCAKCTDKQKKGVKYVIKRLINHKEADWKQLTAKYDPTNNYTSKYEKELREIKA